MSHENVYSAVFTPYLDEIIGIALDKLPVGRVYVRIFCRVRKEVTKLWQI
ncbi:hypothetical protein BH18THE1_BH18THE1_21040 [soil metagenome]